MKQEHVNKLLHKVEEIKALFIIGQRIVPFLEELFKFVQETAPMISDMSESIKESTKKMPKATQQLDKVTEETELATTAMLDKIDNILVKLNEITNSIGQFKDTSQQKQNIFKQIDEQFSSISDFQGKQKLHSSINSIIEESAYKNDRVKLFNDIEKSVQIIQRYYEFATISGYYFSADKRSKQSYRFNSEPFE